MAVRIWEPGQNMSPYDAMHVAATEQCTRTSIAGEAVLATATTLARREHRA